MKLIFHVLWKDFRRLWPYVILGLIESGLNARGNWLLAGPGTMAERRWWALSFVGLYLTWALMIVQLIQHENPTGDREFWTTRPYVWYEVLTAKAMFCILAIGVPLAISQYVLLRLATGSAITSLPLSLWSAGEILLFIAIVVAALASLTQSIGQWLLVALVVAAIEISMNVWLDSYLVNSNVPVVGELIGATMALLFVTLAFSALIVQYATRRRARAAVLAGASLLAPLAIQAFVPYESIISHYYPAVSAIASPFSLATLQPRVGRRLSSDKDAVATLAFPMHFSGIAPDTIIEITATRLQSEIDSNWQTNRRVFVHQQAGSSFQVSLEVPRNALNASGGRLQPAKLLLLFTEFRDSPTAQQVALDNTFRVAGIGRCWRLATGDISCQTPNENPPFIMAIIEEQFLSCDGGTNARENIKGPFVAFNSDSGFPLSPIGLRRLWMGEVWRFGGNCHSTAAIFSTPSFVRRVRTELDLGDVRLRDYEATIPYDLKLIQ